MNAFVLLVLFAPAPMAKAAPPPPAIKSGSYVMTWRGVDAETIFHPDGFYACQYQVLFSIEGSCCLLAHRYTRIGGNVAGADMWAAIRGDAAASMATFIPAAKPRFSSMSMKVWA